MPVKIKKTTIKKKVVKTAVPTKDRTELELGIYDTTGKVEKTLNLPKEIFSTTGSPNVLAQYVRVYLTNQRAGTASTKTRSEVTGSTRKIYRQKGTGRARHGDIKAPIFVGGGVVGGPKPHNYVLRINDKQKKKALLLSLTLKTKEKNIIGLSSEFLKMQAKTKIFATFLKTLQFSEKTKGLLVLPKMEKNNLVLAARNLPNIEMTDVQSLNPYSILKNRKLFLLEDSLKVLEKRFKQ